MVFLETKSKIVCTIGPASSSKDVLEKMVEAGMDVARLNMSHEDHETARKTFNVIRSIDDTLSILFDLPTHCSDWVPFCLAIPSKYI